MGHVDEIDGMRAIAVAAVLAFHAFPGLVPGGYIGVDIFFVISGFIITRIYYDKLITKRTSLSEFYARRIRRLMPVYLFVILFSTIGAYFVLDPPLLKNYSESLAAQVVYLQNFAFWVQGSYFAVPLSKPLLHTWSLAVEEQFYLIYAIPVLLARWWPKAALVLILLIASLSYAVGDVLAVVSPKTNFFLLPARIWEFALGFGVARLAAARLCSFGGYSVTAGLAMAFAAIFLFEESTLFPGPQALLACLGTCFVILGCDSPSLPNRLLCSTPLRYVGQRSYSLYLWHWPIISLVATYLGHTLSPELGALALLLSLVLAHFSYAYIEQPFQQRQILGELLPMLASVAAASLMLVGAASIMYFTHGATFRYAPLVSRLYVAEQTRSPYRCGYWKRITGFPSEMCSIANPDQARPDSVLVLGDSHADQLDEMIGSIGMADQYDVYLTTRNCTLDSYGSTDYCSWSVLEHIVQEIKEKRIKYVIAVAYMDDDINAKAVKKSVKALKRNELEQIFIMNTVPSGPYFSPETRIQEVETGKNIATSYSTARYLRDSAGSRKLYSALARKSDQVSVIDPLPYICPDDQCRFQINGKPLYFDEHHLSPTGAKVVRPLFERVFESFDDLNNKGSGI
ncbi:MAG: hypothetical protein CMP08_06550 [Xanthomonadales bacterium]|nr:hypothetical protein [Xanthomonadales bacterium]|tara:strand:- start:743 stop:2623 length:1881 start_codon:yes stop_codon:yes gene_type:complete